MIKKIPKKLVKIRNNRRKTNNIIDKKRNYYNLYENQFIDLTDDEEDIKKIKKREEKHLNREIIKKNKFLSYRIIPIYQEDFYSVFSRENIFHKYEVFNQEIKGLYTNKKMQQLFENLFNNYNNNFNKKISRMNKTFSYTNYKNSINFIPSLNSKNKKDSFHILNKNKIKKYTSIGKIIDKLKKKILIQRKQLNKNILLTINNKKLENEKNNFINKLNKNSSDINKSGYIKHNLNNYSSIHINKINNYSIIKSKKNSDLNSYNSKRNDNNNIYTSLKKISKIKNIDKRNKIKKITINKNIFNNINKRYNINKKKEISPNIKNSSEEILNKYHLNNDKLVIKRNDLKFNKNFSYDLHYKSIDKRNINKILINKFSKSLLLKMKLFNNINFNSSIDMNNINSILLNENH